MENYYEQDISPLDATLDIADWVTNQVDGLTIYIYENWPDMAGYAESFLPTEAEFAAYNEYTTGDAVEVSHQILFLLNINTQFSLVTDIVVEDLKILRNS